MMSNDKIVIDVLSEKIESLQIYVKKLELNLSELQNKKQSDEIHIRNLVETSKTFHSLLQKCRENISIKHNDTSIKLLKEIDGWLGLNDWNDHTVEINK